MSGTAPSARTGSQAQARGPLQARLKLTQGGHLAGDHITEFL